MFDYQDPAQRLVALQKLQDERLRRRQAVDEVSKEQNRIKSAERFRRKFYSYFPDDGPLRRELYVPHLKFFEAGAKFRERAFIAGNRCGKTSAAAYETTAHLTGLYPHWWKGKRFDHATKGWASGTKSIKTRDIIQQELLGRIKRKDNENVVTGIGTGMLPGRTIGDTRPRSGIPDAVEIIYVKHVSGEMSQLMLKSYEQGRDAFEGESIDFAWLDEEPPEDVYTECIMRTMTTDGVVFLTFTPLQGLSSVVMRFLPAGQYPTNGVVQV